MSQPAWISWMPDGVTWGADDEPCPKMCARPGCATILRSDAGDLCPIHIRYGGSK